MLEGDTVLLSPQTIFVLHLNLIFLDLQMFLRCLSRQLAKSFNHILPPFIWKTAGIRPENHQVCSGTWE